MGETPETPESPGPRTALAERAIADLAGRVGADRAAITVVSAEDVTWPDSSLGCPEEGKLYQQALTDGVRVVLELAGRRYEYHAGGARQEPFFCADPRPPVGG